MQDLTELIRRHAPDPQAESVECACGARFWTIDSWSRHLAEEVDLFYAQKALDAK